MFRLALAIIAALVFHVLLLMIVVPDPQVLNPEIIGSGQVTVSIVRSPQKVEQPEDVVREEHETDVLPEYSEEVLPKVDEESAPTQPIETTEPDPVIFKDKVLESIPVDTHEKPAQTNPVPEDKPDTIVDEKSDAKQEQQEVLPEFSETEILQSPEPIIHRNKPPEYPSLARKRGWEGTVILEVDIRSDGMVKDIRVTQSSPYAMLDKEAMRAVRKWYFQPGSRAGKFVDMKVLVPVHFVLERP